MKLVTVQDLNEGDLLTFEVFSEKHKVSIATLRSWAKMCKRSPADYPRIITIGKTNFISSSDFVRLVNRKLQEKMAG